MKKKKKVKKVTIVGADYYFGVKIFSVDSIYKIRKDPENKYDPEAIKVILGKKTIGYVANSFFTVADGTYSAGRIYDKIGKKAKVKVKFILGNKVIAKVID